MDTVSESSPEVSSGLSSPKKSWGIKSFFSWVEGLKEELKRVTWTTKQQLKSSTKIVVISIFSFGFGIYLVDLVVKGVLDGVATLVRVVFG